MSGDVQPRKRKDKKKKKDEPSLPPFVYVKEDPPVIVASGGGGGGGNNGGGSPSAPSADELIHVYKESRLGGNICAKIIFFLLLGTLTVMVGFIITEHRGSNEVATAPDSPWSQMLEGWIDDSPPDKHDDEHDAPTEDSGEHDEDDEHADHDDGEGDEHDEHDDEGEGDHEDEEDNAVLEQELKARAASNVGSESKVSAEEEAEEEGYNTDDNDEDEQEEEQNDQESEDQGEEEEEEEDHGEELFQENETSNEQNDFDEGEDRNEESDDENGEPEEGDDQDEPRSEEEQGENNEDDQGEDNASAEERFQFREIPGVTASAEDTDDNGDIDSAQGNIDQDEEDDINDWKGQGSDAGYNSAKEDDDSDEGDGDEKNDDDDDDEGDNIDNDIGGDDEEDQSEDQIEANDDDAENEEKNSAEDDEGYADFRLRGDQTEEDNIEDEEEEEKDNNDDEPQHNYERSRHIDDYEEVEHEVNSVGGVPTYLGDDASAEQELESDDDFEEILEPAEPAEAENLEEESASMEPVGLALKFGVGIAIIIVAHVVLVRKWNESDESGATTLQPTMSPTATVPRRQTLIPPSVDPSNLIPEPDDDEEYSDEEFDEDEEEDPIYAKTIRETLASKYGKLSPGASDEEVGEEEEEEDEEDEEDVEDVEDVDDEEERPEEGFDKRYGFKLASVPTKQLSQEEDEELDDEELEEEEDEEEEEEGEYTSHSHPWKNIRQSQQESDPEISDQEEVSGDEQPLVWKRTSGPKEAESIEPEWPMGPDYPPDQSSVPSSTQPPKETPSYDALEAHMEENPDAVLKRVKRLLAVTPKEVALLSLQAKALDKLAERQHSNKLLEDAIAAYLSLLQSKNINDDLFLKTADRCINRMRFRGQHGQAVSVNKMLIVRFPNNPKYHNDLTITYLMIGRVSEAKSLLEETLQKWPENGVALVHYGFVLKTSENNNKEGARYMQAGIDSKEPGTMDARFLFHLGDAYNRLGQHMRAEKVYELGADKKLFRSKYQRSLYNVDRLTARPWWTLEQTPYAKELRKFEEKWKEIRDEGMSILQSHSKASAFKDETENLRDKGVWKQLELYARGQQITSNCKKASVTCKLIAQFPAAHSCRRGQAKFSVMQPNTHVWPHCGPTNCRLRAHLGLVVPPGTELRVGQERRSWQEGKVFIFDDSFEHEVWHNGTSMRLVLIIDIWHPELTERERRSLPAI